VAEPAVKLLDDDAVLLRRTGVRFPVELRPIGLNGDDPRTWPEAEGRLEWVQGRLLYMPPCADIQQDVAVDLVHVLRGWSEGQPSFVVGGNEAGMKLGQDIRAADAAVWRRAEVGPSTGRLRHTPPVLAVEVAGQDEDEQSLRNKAAWYVRYGVAIVWLILPESREVIVFRDASESRHAASAELPVDPRLPGLAPSVARFFVQLDQA
jgi:Uma2 family endonuclease